MNKIHVFLSTCITKDNLLIFSFRVVELCVKKLEDYLEITKMKETKVNINFRNKSCEPSILHKEYFNETSPRSPLSAYSSDSSDLEFDGSYKSVEVTKEVVLENDNKSSENKVEDSVANAKSFSLANFKKPPRAKTKPNRTFYDDSLEACYSGSYLLKQSRDLVSLGGNPENALDFALRAMKSFEKCANEKPNLDLVMCLHVVASLYCKLGKYNEAITFLNKAIDIPKIDDGKKYALAKFAGCMQLGDTYVLMGHIENSISFYNNGLEIQKQVLGEKDHRFGETCRYVAEAHVQFSQFDEAEKLCNLALGIHSEKGSSPSLKGASIRRLMGIICDSKGNYETALEHYVLARMAMSANGHEKDAALIDISIGDTYLALDRYKEAIFSYEKALNMLKSTEGENNTLSASLFVRLADLYNKIGKYKESKCYCEQALGIYSKPFIPSKEIARDLVNVSATYESMNEFEQALELLRKAMKMYENIPEKELGQQSTVAGIEARMGVLYYLMGSYSDSYYSFKNAVLKFQEIGENKSAIFGLVLNQMGLACVQIYAIHEAAELFEKSRIILENEYGPYHTETLGVCSNLAGTYDAMGRSSDAIEILEYVVGVREQKLGTANPDGDDEKRRLTELLKENGRVRNRKSKSLETLLENVD